MGVKWWNINVFGEEEFCNKGVIYCLYCDGFFFEGKDVVVIGGGNLGMEVVLDLVGVIKYVIVLEFLFEFKVD